MSNIIVATFVDGCTTAVTEAIYEGDYGMILQFAGLDLPDVYTVNFGNEAVSPLAHSMIGNADGVEIPNQLLTESGHVMAWVFLHTGEDDGETEYAVTIPVLEKMDTQIDDPTPEQESALNQAIAALNAGVERAETAADSAEQIAADLGDFETAMEAVTEAKNAAEQSASNASVSEGNAAQSAQNASQSATSAATSAEGAYASEEAAAQSADDAESSASAAATSATNAAASEAAARAVEESIPEDYTALSNDVSDLKSAINLNDDVYLLDGIDVTIERGSSNTVIVNIPRRVTVLKNGTNTVIDFLSAQSVTVPHNNILYLDTNNDLQVDGLGNSLLQANNVILLYNNTGICSGQWAYAQKITRIFETERKTGSFINGLYVNVTVSAKNIANTITVGVPRYVIVFDDANNGTSVDLGSATAYTLAHNEMLYFDHDTNTISKGLFNNTIKNLKNWTVLLFNNSGYAIGQWGYIQRLSDVIDLEKRFCCEIIPIDVIGTTNQLFVSTPQSNTITVRVPRRVAVYDDNNVGTAVDFATPQTYTLAHNGVLYYDHTDSTIKVGATGNTLNIAKNWTLLLLNNYGHAYGQWARYQTESIYSAPFTSLVLSSRQGDAGNYPENSLAGFRHSKFVGYSKVRGSCSFTSDGVGVMFHDRTLGATGIVYDSEGNVVTDTSKNIEDYTYSELQQYDFGLYRGSEFSGTVICTLEDFIKQAKQLGQEIDIELKYGLSEANMLSAYNLTVKYGMTFHTRWSNETLSNLQYMKSINPYLTLGLIITKQNYLVDNAASLMNGTNEVWCCLMGSDLPFADSFIQYIASKGLRTKLGSVNSGTAMRTNCGFDELEVSLIEYPEWQIIVS